MLHRIVELALSEDEKCDAMQLLALRALMHASFHDEPRATLAKVSFAPRAMLRLDRLLGQREPPTLHPKRTNRSKH